MNYEKIQNSGRLSDETYFYDDIEDVPGCSSQTEISEMFPSQGSLRRWKIACVASFSALLCTWGILLSSVQTGLTSHYKTDSQLRSTNGKLVPYVMRNVPYFVSPADDTPHILEWEPLRFNSNFNEDRTKWQGPPNDSVDKAWEELYLNIGVVLANGSTASQLPDETIEIPGLNDQYVLGVGLFHQLHCLDMVRQAMYPTRYNISSDRIQEHVVKKWDHLEHCVEQIRQVIMCYGDLSTVSWEWDQKEDLPASKFATTRICRNFDNIHAWATEKAFTGEMFNKQLRMYGHNYFGTH